MKGFDNPFVIENVFGNELSFTGEQIYALKTDAFGSCVEIQWYISQKPVSPPDKWGNFDKVLLRIDFWGVREIHTVFRPGFNPEFKAFIVGKYEVSELDGGAYKLMIESVEGHRIEFDYEIARVQNVKPMVKSPDGEGYVVAGRY